MYKNDNLTDKAIYCDALKAVFQVGLLSLGNRAGEYAARQSINYLQELGASDIRITIKGVPTDPEVFEYDFKVPPENVIGDGK